MWHSEVLFDKSVSRILYVCIKIGIVSLRDHELYSMFFVCLSSVSGPMIRVAGKEQASRFSIEHTRVHDWERSLKNERQRVKFAVSRFGTQTVVPIHIIL